MDDLRASALATGCSVEVSGMEPPVHELRQNKALGSVLPSDDPCHFTERMLWEQPRLSHGYLEAKADLSTTNGV